MFKRSIVAGLFGFALCLNAQHLSPDVKKALDSIHASDLRGDLSFIASDLLEGRYTPSPGLDIAAEFIASKFRAAGIEPGANGDYFQVASMLERKLPNILKPLVVRMGDNEITVDPAKIQVRQAAAAANVVNAPVIKITERTPEKLKDLDLDGKVVLVSSPDIQASPASQRMNLYRDIREFDKTVAASKALMEVVIAKTLPRNPVPRLLFADEASSSTLPVLVVESSELARAVDSPESLTLSLEMPAPEDLKVSAKNVVGILRGSDPRLKSTCVLVTAHYDHIGTTSTGAGLGEGNSTGADKVFNGANDDGSGTVSVIEIARALSQLHHKRSIVFITFFGEERGLLGSTYYGRHPLFPITDTVADINLEQVGRTDSTEGPKIANASITGYDYSDVTKYLEAAGTATGVRIYKDDPASDEYFVRSDNAALAEHGVPAHTLTTAFDYPDYHGLGDEWQKIDYENMAKVDRTVALAVLNIADSRKAPEWDQENARTEQFREARKRNKAGAGNVYPE